MKTYARIEQAVVVELLETAGDIAKMFHHDLVWVAVPAGEEVTCGWTYIDGQFASPIVQAPTLGELRSEIAARRYQAETAGITVNGMDVPTDRDSQAMVTGAALQAVIDQNYTCQWKTAGGFVDMDAPQIIALASAMRAHVQACFDREAALLDALTAGTYTDEQLDQGWPA